MVKRIKNPIIACTNCLQSYFSESHVRSPILAKPNDWSPIIAIFSA